MSMPKIEKNENPVNREQSITNLIESVALMETGLSHVINAEGEKIQKVVNSEEDSLLDDVLKINDSVNKMVNSVTKLEMLLQNKLEMTRELESPEEALGSIIPYASRYVGLSAENGLPMEGILFGFGATYDSNIRLNGNPEIIDFTNPDDYVDPNIAFSMPRDGILDSFTAFFHPNAELYLENDVQVIARLYVSEPNLEIYYPIEHAIIYLQPKLVGEIPYDTIVRGTISNLGIKIASERKLLMIFYITTELPDSFGLHGYGGGGLNIK